MTSTAHTDMDHTTDHAADAADTRAGSNPVYTLDDYSKAAGISQWLKKHELSRAWLSKKTGISNGTISQILNGKYPASPTAQLDEMQAVIDLESERAADGTPGYVEGSVHKLVSVVCDRTRKHAAFGVLTGHVGVGKTRSCKEYAARKPQTLLVEASPRMTPGVLLDTLLRLLGKAIPAGLDRKFNEIVIALQGTNYLVIADEAENMSADALHYLRRLRDMARIGIVLVGTEKLHNLINPLHGQFDQIRSRVAMWPKTIPAITRDDADDMARAALGDLLKPGQALGDDVLDALWSYCDGSARVLMESLIPAIKDYGMGKGEISAKLIDAIAASVLFMTRSTRK